MAKHKMDMVLEWAKVFEENLDKGNPDSSQKWLRDLAKSGGKATVKAYFTSEDQIDTLTGVGFERMALNPNTGEEVDRIKVGEEAFGIGKYINLTRKFSDVKEIKDRKTGEFVDVEFGGLPKVIDFRDPDNKRYWSYEEDGPIGNGTEAKVQFDLYKGRTLRLEAIGVTKLVEFVLEDADDEFTV